MASKWWWDVEGTRFTGVYATRPRSCIRFAALWAAVMASAATSSMADDAARDAAVEQEALARGIAQATVTEVARQIEAADALVHEGKRPEAVASFLDGLETAHLAKSPQAVQIDERLESILKSVPDMPEADLEAIRRGFPEWDTLQTVGTKEWRLWFHDACRKKYEGQGDAARAEAAARATLDTAWKLLTEYSTNSVARKAVNAYLEVSEALGEEKEARQALADYVSTLKPCVASFCAEYRFAEAAQEAGDAGAVTNHCRHLLDIYGKGALLAALDDPLANGNDALLIDYHVAYAHYVLGEFGASEEHCDRMLARYADVKNWSGQEHGALVKTRVLRAMAIAAQDIATPSRGLEAYDALLSQYPDNAHRADALLQKGRHLEKFGRTAQALACFDQAALVKPGSTTSMEAHSLAQDLRKSKMTQPASP